MTARFSLQGERALITGGGTGIGLGMARCFVQAGARVVLVGRRESELSKAAAELGSAALFISHDITKLEQAGELVAKAASAAGGAISILVNNAGHGLKKSALETTDADLQAMLQTHVIAAHALTRAVLPSMLQRKHGSILFTASMASFLGVAMVLAYSAAKSAYLAMVRSLASELGPEGIRVNGIAPGWIESPMLQKALDNDPQRRQKILSRTALGGFGQPEDVGWAAVYLCSEAARFVTGVVLPVDGGASIGL